MHLAVVTITLIYVPIQAMLHFVLFESLCSGGLSFAVNKPIAAVMMLLDSMVYEDIQVIIVWVALTFT